MEIRPRGILDINGRAPWYEPSNLTVALHGRVQGSSHAYGALASDGTWAFGRFELCDPTWTDTSTPDCKLCMELLALLRIIDMLAPGPGRQATILATPDTGEWLQSWVSDKPRTLCVLPHCHRQYCGLDIASTARERVCALAGFLTVMELPPGNRYAQLVRHMTQIGQKGQMSWRGRSDPATRTEHVAEREGYVTYLISQHLDTRDPRYHTPPSASQPLSTT